MLSLDILTSVFFFFFPDTFQKRFIKLLLQDCLLLHSICKLAWRWPDIFTVPGPPMQKHGMPLHLFCSSFISPIKFCSCLYIGHTHFSLSLSLSIFPWLLGMASLFSRRLLWLEHRRALTPGAKRSCLRPLYEAMICLYTSKLLPWDFCSQVAWTVNTVCRVGIRWGSEPGI